MSWETTGLVGAAIFAALFLILVAAVVVALWVVLRCLKQVLSVAMADQEHRAEILRIKRDERNTLERLREQLRILRQNQQAPEAGGLPDFATGGFDLRPEGANTEEAEIGLSGRRTRAGRLSRGRE
uniref:Uncharacterized protein n=1 Tax=viral metagenome TaxID=1070528 RepID=A0A6H1ZWF9_9ZZZZ